MNTRSVVKASSYFGFGGAFILLGMMVAGWNASSALAGFGQPGTPESYAEILRGVTDPLQAVMALDNLFVVAYLGTFIGAAALLWDKTRAFAAVGVGFALLTGLIDLVENAITVDITRAVEAAVPILEAQISAVSFLGLVKYSVAGAALATLGVGLLIALPKTMFNRATAVIFILFPVVNAVTVPNPSASLLLVIWMLLMLILSGVLLRRQG